MVKCEIKECKTGASYGIKQEFATRCKKHGEKDMVHNSRTYCSHGKQHSKCEDCRNDLTCSIDGCEEKSVYGVKQRFPTRCKMKEHREEKMVAKPRSNCQHGRQRNHCKQCDGVLICKHGRRRNHCKQCDGASICIHEIQCYKCYICKSESNYFCIRRYNNGNRCIRAKMKNSKYDNYCATCFIDLFPNDSRSKTAGLPIKEFEVRQQLNIAFPNRFIYGKQLVIADRKEKCTSLNRFIDAQTEFKNCVLIIEIDENQHKKYDLKDEKLRIVQIRQNAEKNLIVVRFNPDKYIENGEIKNPKMSKRYEVLKDKINEIIDKIKSGYKFDSQCTEIKLFFDDGSKIKDDTTIYCAGFSKGAKRRCIRKVAKEGMFCHSHKSQSSI